MSMEAINKRVGSFARAVVLLVGCVSMEASKQAKRVHICLGVELRGNKRVGVDGSYIRIAGRLRK